MYLEGWKFFAMVYNTSVKVYFLLFRFFFGHGYIPNNHFVYLGKYFIWCSCSKKTSCNI
jgi:hypothetical protein